MGRRISSEDVLKYFKQVSNIHHHNGVVSAYEYYVVRKDLSSTTSYLVFVYDYNITMCAALYLVDMTNRYIQRLPIDEGLDYELFDHIEEYQEDLDGWFPLEIGEKIDRTLILVEGSELLPFKGEDSELGRKIVKKNGVLCSVHHKFRIILSSKEKKELGYDKNDFVTNWIGLKDLIDRVWKVHGFCERHFDLLKYATENFG